jgi:hypothetical protein
MLFPNLFRVCPDDKLISAGQVQKCMRFCNSIRPLRTGVVKNATGRP